MRSSRLASIPATSDTVERDGRQMKQCWIKYSKIPTKNSKNPKNPKNPKKSPKNPKKPKKIQKNPKNPKTLLFWKCICLADDLRVEPVPLEDGVEPGEAVQQVVQGSL